MQIMIERKHVHKEWGGKTGERRVGCEKRAAVLSLGLPDTV